MFARFCFSGLLLSLLIGANNAGLRDAVSAPKNLASQKNTAPKKSVVSKTATGDSLVRVTFRPEKKPNSVKQPAVKTVDGRVLVTAQDGGILLESRDAVLWNITPKQMVSKVVTKKSFTPLTSKEIGQSLQKEFGKSFQIHTTKHYVICSDAGTAYMKWCGILFERLFRAFQTYWRTSRLALSPPKFPLVAIIFKDRKDFARYAATDTGLPMATSVGYYSVRMNRMVLFDLTGTAKAKNNRARPVSAEEISRRIAKSSFNIATIIHEATHQIAFLSGMHKRYADNPLWLTEGMAMYFETPNLRNQQGWQTVGTVNAVRMRQFRDYVRKRRKGNSLISLIGSNKRLTDAKTSKDAYAESWALTYFLIKTRRATYQRYLKEIAKKKPLIWDSPAERLALFRKLFGADLKKLDQTFLRSMSRIR